MYRTRVAWQLLAVSSLLITGCSDWSYNIQKDRSYVISGRNYTYAIYNNDHRLMTHPIEDLKSQLEYREKACPNNPITDIYVVSHGWNYTPSEAAANYHNYIQLADTALQERAEMIEPGSVAFPSAEGCPNPILQFQPFFVFITWASTSKPVSELANSVLPFQLDTLLRPITFIIDNGPIYLATAWKQSLNASANALGRNYPDSYLFRNWYGDKSEYGTNSYYYEDERTGRDLPVSTIIYELVRCKLKKQECQLGSQGLAAKVHLVGHSYGAKVVALAGMEALRRYSLVDIIGLPDRTKKEREKKKSVIATEYDKIMDQQFDEIMDYFGHTSKEATALVWSCILIFGCPAEKTAEDAIDVVYDKITESGKLTLPIESLVLIAPAMHPGEFWYPTDSFTNFRKAPASILRLIPRKAVVYSQNDFANGTLFNLREIILNTQVSQNFNSFQNQSNLFIEEKLGKGALPVRLLFNLVYAPLSLGYSVLYGTGLYAVTTVSNLLDIRQPGDLFHHVLHNNSFDDPKWLDPKHTQERDILGRGWRYVYNSIDYFVPLYPLGPWRQEDMQGLFRMSRPALGKTGLARIADGRLPGINLMGLASFYSGEKTPDYNSDTFCQFSYWHEQPSQELDSIGEVDGNLTRKLLYSFDASKVYDSSNPLTGGSHSDVRDFKEDPKKDEGIACKPDQQKLAKRKFSFMFVYRFTKTNFIESANHIEQSVLDERQEQYQREHESQGATTLSAQ